MAIFGYYKTSCKIFDMNCENEEHIDGIYIKINRTKKKNLSKKTKCIKFKFKCCAFFLFE